LHSKVEPTSLEANENEGLGLEVKPAGPELICVCGAAASTENDREAGLASVTPALVARTSKVCAPEPRFEYDSGELHEAQVPVSILHSNVDPTLLDEKVNEGLAFDVGPMGPESICVSGGPVSSETLNDRVAGLGSVLPGVSVARTSKVCGPGARLE
jgi:hypothetical protein